MIGLQRSLIGGLAATLALSLSPAARADDAAKPAATAARPADSKPAAADTKADTKASDKDAAVPVHEKHRSTPTRPRPRARRSR